MKLYELVEEFKELEELASDEAIDQQTIADTLESVGAEIEEKADGYAKVIKTLEGNVDVIDKEIKRLTEKKNTIKNNVTNIKNSLENAMLITGKTKFKTELFSFGIQKNPPSVVIDDESKIPQDFYIEQDPKLDKTALKNFLKENEVTYAHLQQTEGLRIR